MISGRAEAQIAKDQFAQVCLLLDTNLVKIPAPDIKHTILL